MGWSVFSGIDQNGIVRVEVDMKYYRPCEVDLLLGDPEKARNVLGGAPLVLPLVGSGLSGIGLPARDILNLIILSIISESKKRQIATLIKLVLAPDLYGEIDLAEVKKYWR